MTLSKLSLADDGTKVSIIAWANANKQKAGDSLGSWRYVEIDMTQAEIDKLKTPALAGAVTLTDQNTATETVVDTPATQTKAAVTHEVTKLVSGHLTLAADYVAPAEPEPMGPQPSQQELINANLTKQLASVTQMATISQAAVVTLTKQVAEQASTNTEAK